MATKTSTKQVKPIGRSTIENFFEPIVQVTNKRKIVVDERNVKKPQFCTPNEKERDIDAHSDLFNKTFEKVEFCYASPPVPNTTPHDIFNIDDMKTKSPTYDPTYAMLIHNNHKQREAKYVIANTVLVRWQPAITRKIYAILFNYLSEISAENMLQTRSFVLCMHLLDRVLQDQYRHLKRESERIPLGLDKFQLLGCACLLIACKIEEVYPPSADALVKTSGNSFDKNHLFAMECTVLRDLRFMVLIPTRLDFALRFGLAAQLNKREMCLLSYIIECSFLEFDLNKATHSLVAAAAVHITLQSMRDPEDVLWSVALQHYTSYQESEIASLVMVLADVRHSVDGKIGKGLLQKYSTDEHCCVADVMALPFAQVRFDDMRLFALHKPKSGENNKPVVTVNVC